MKKILYCLVVLTGLFALSSCDDDKRVDYRYLPAAIHEFVDTYFADVQVVKTEEDDDEPRYKVWLSNGFELKFYKEGGWQEVDGNWQVLPSALQIGILPGNLLTYTATEYPDAGIVEAARYSWGYQVELNTSPSIELHFNNDGEITMTDRH
ncbi:MAG TPA: PepSY-like domain-containing protein [Candidatus Barnesiella excrementavium]|nr:PepSY-like domain-containing protein [Candidatus Barnesiella excrementavium]